MKNIRLERIQLLPDTGAQRNYFHVLSANRNISIKFDETVRHCNPVPGTFITQANGSLYYSVIQY